VDASLRLFFFQEPRADKQTTDGEENGYTDRAVVIEPLRIESSKMEDLIVVEDNGEDGDCTPSVQCGDVTAAASLSLRGVDHPDFRALSSSLLKHSSDSLAIEAPAFLPKGLLRIPQKVRLAL
jgi:hypothetical protein